MESVWTNPEVAVEDLPQLSDVHFQRHPVRYRNYRILGFALFWTIPVVAGLVVAIATGHEVAWSIFAGLFIPVTLSYLAARIGYYKRSYALRERDITYKKGWLFFSTVTIPFNRIQHTEVSQGPLERKFDLSSLKIYTAGGSTSDLTIPGLDSEEAQNLRDYIARKATLNV